MNMRRREFFGTAAVAGAGLLAGTRVAAQETPARAGGPPKTPTYAPKIEMLWKSPDRYPNALEASPEGLWVGDQVSERINLLDWKTGKVLEDFIGEAHNTSGLAVGGGFIWVGCNGSGTAAQLREFKRPYDRNYGEIVKLDMKGKQVKGYRTPWGSQHGTYYHRPTDKLWAVAPGFGMLAEMDPKDDLRITRLVQIRTMNVPHGLDMHEGSIYVIDGADRLVHRLDGESGRVQESWVFGPNDPDPHGMCVYDNHVYFTDAGLGGGRKPSAGTKPQMIFRFPLTRG